MSGRKGDGPTVGVRLVLVAYYIRTLAEIRALVDDFSRSSGIPIERTLVVDNGAALAVGQHGDVEVLPGDNDFWEFSAWVKGLKHPSSLGEGLVVLLNDSYRRNWTIKWPGRLVIASMLRHARRGKVAGWLDNFTRRQRQVNSRIVILPGNLSSVLKRSIEEAILRCRSCEASGTPLLDSASQDQLTRWFATQDGRWTAASMASRLKRVFVEHHLFDEVPADLLSLHPSTWIGSQIYGLARKRVGERR